MPPRLYTNPPLRAINPPTKHHYLSTATFDFRAQQSTGNRIEIPRTPTPTPRQSDSQRAHVQIGHRTKAAAQGGRRQFGETVSERAGTRGCPSVMTPSDVINLSRRIIHGTAKSAERDAPFCIGFKLGVGIV
mgnify:CR=1 FL=1